jgi:hypothetical protein
MANLSGLTQSYRSAPALTTDRDRSSTMAKPSLAQRIQIDMTFEIADGHWLCEPNYCTMNEPNPAATPSQAVSKLLKRQLIILLWAVGILAIAEFGMITALTTVVIGISHQLGQIESELGILANHVQLK